MSECQSPNCSGCRHCVPTWKTEPKTWTTRDGRVIEITAMGDSHLVSAARMIRRNLSPELVERVRLYGFVTGPGSWPMPNGEYAREAVEREIDAEGERIGNGERDDQLLRGLLPTYRALREEIERRGLTPD